MRSLLKFALLSGAILGASCSKQPLVTTDQSNSPRSDSVEQELNPEPTAAPPSPTPAPTAIRKVQEGDQMPEFSLTNDRGERMSNETYAGKFLVLTFTYTRCQDTDQCLLVAHNFMQLAQRIDGDEALRSRLQLLSVSFDPLHDQSEALTRYRVSYDAPRAFWQVATGSRKEIHRLTEAFAIPIQENSGTFTHELCTVIVDRTGRIKTINRTNTWTVDDIIAQTQ